MIAEVVQTQIKIKNIRTNVVISRPKQMYAWPGMVKISEREILVAASERLHHTCPYGREVIVRSTDAGQSWTLPQEVYNSELDDRDSNLNIAPDGTLILSWFTSTAFENHWTKRAKRVSNLMRDELLGPWMCCSRDMGDNWDEPRRMPVGGHISPSVLSDGSLLVIGEEPRNESALAVYKSGDMGISWRKATKIYCTKHWREEYKRKMSVLNENHVLETSPGKLMVMFRSNPSESGHLFQAFSEDYGESWTKPCKTEIWGYPPQLLRLENGVIMCSYSHRRAPYSIRAVFSYDEGRTWDTDNIQTLYQWEDEPDMGYPTSIELSPGEILTVFYCSRRDADHPGQTQRMDGNSPEGVLSVSFTLENY